MLTNDEVQLRQVCDGKPEACTFSEFIGVEPKGAQLLFVSPHDDDVVLGFSLLIQTALAAGSRVSIAVVTDGSMGFWHDSEGQNIASHRRKEAEAAFCELGVNKSNISFLGFPDCRLSEFKGAWKNEQGQLFGLQVTLTKLLRSVDPAVVFVPTPNDLHPDHKVVGEQLLISLFHASGEIWEQVGVVKKDLPSLFYGAVYCELDKVTHAVFGSQNYFAAKIRAIEKFQSQRQIDSLVNGIREQPPIEAFEKVSFTFHDRSRLKGLFSDSDN